MASVPPTPWGMTEPLERYLLQVTEILNSCYMQLLGGHHKLKHLWKCPAAINLESIKQGRDSAAGKVERAAAVSCLQAEPLNER